MLKRLLIFVILFTVLFSFSVVPVFGHTPSWHSSKYAYKADSNYYNDHFKTYINVISANTSTYESHHADGALTYDNQSGDTWAMYYHTMHSGGYLNYSSSVHGSHAHSGGLSSHYEQWYYTKYITKGSNKISFSINYKLRRYAGGPVVENHYMTRSRTNF